MRFIVQILVWLSIVGCTHLQENVADKEKVVLVHGFGRSPAAMDNFADYFETQGFQVFNLGYSSLTQNMREIKKEFYSKVDEVIGVSDQTYHFVGHSLGGLLIRSYLRDRTVKKLGKVVTLGSPSKGTPVVDHLKNKWYFFMTGPAMDSLSAKGSEFLVSLKPPYYPLGVIAGVTDRDYGEDIFRGRHDGVVPLESTVVEGSKDYLVMSVSHHQMRYDREVMRQTLHFLSYSSFAHPENGSD